MTTFKKLNTKKFVKSGPVITEDFIYWKQLSPPVLVKEFGPIDYIDFSPIEPYHFAVTCSVRVQIYNPITKLVVKNLSRFQLNAYSGTFRQDGRLLCAGGEEGVVKLFDVSSKSLLRLFEGHTAPVHRTFFVHTKPQIASFSDDKSVKIWDIPTEKPIVTYNEHNDYVRAGATNPTTPNTILSGGYDGIVQMYDTRQEKKVLTFDHGSPIQSLLFLPSGSIFLSAGGTEIKIWDLLAGGRLLGCISQHHKTITCLRLASDNKRILSGSLDRHVKIYDVNTFKVVHTLDYPNAVLSLGVSKNDDTIAAGMVDGVVSISRREQQSEKPIEKKKKVSHKFASYEVPKSVDDIVAEPAKELQSRHDVCLRKFQYSKALDCVLLPYVMNKHPEVTVTLMQELIKRKALDRAFTGRDSKSILQILRFFQRNLTDYRFTRVLIHSFNIFLDVYDEMLHLMPPEVFQTIVNISKLIKQEIELGDNLAALQGSMSMLLTGANVQENVVEKEDVIKNLLPSKDATKAFVVNVT